jgi:hypothetical protein
MLKTKIKQVINQGRTPKQNKVLINYGSRIAESGIKTTFISQIKNILELLKR